MLKCPMHDVQYRRQRAQLTPHEPAPYCSQYEIGSKAGRIAIHPRGVAHSQLMSAPSSPGGTWLILVAERGLPVLVGTLTAVVSYGSDRGSCLSGLGD